LISEADHCELISEVDHGELISEVDHCELRVRSLLSAQTLRHEATIEYNEAT
jgi:hypothetical protein